MEMLGKSETHTVADTSRKVASHTTLEEVVVDTKCIDQQKRMSSDTLNEPIEEIPPTKTLLMNVNYQSLTANDTESIQLCTQLFSSITGTPIEKSLLTVGLCPDGTTHSILAVWNDLDHTLDTLIAFVQVKTPNTVLFKREQEGKYINRQNDNLIAVCNTRIFQEDCAQTTAFTGDFVCACMVVMAC
jgi:hypothetical protein